MGVQNLWVLLAPVGRQIELESLAGQVLAVDASIWLTQFVKAMRDDEGNMIRNAHLLGTFHRVAKLLYYGVRPVFVFDGQTPEIKKRTTARRRKRQETQVANLRHTAQRLLLNRLKMQRQELKKNGGAPPSATAPGFVLPGAPKSSSKATEPSNAASDDAERDATEVRDDVGAATLPGAVETEAKEDATAAGGWTGSANEDDEASDLTVDDIALDTSQLSKIDLHAVFSLPPHLQKDMIQKILRDRRQEVRDQFIPLAGNPEAYSHTQISAFLATSALNKRIEAAKRQKKDEEMQGQAGGPGVMGPGCRIDSNSSRFFVYQKGEDENTKDEAESEDVIAEVERTHSAEQSALADSLSPEKRSVRRRTQKEDGEELEKRPLSAFTTGAPGLMPDASATAVAAPWIAREAVRAKQEPTLAIEKLRLAKLKREEPVAPTVQATETQPSVRGVTISLALDDVAPQELEQFKRELLSTSRQEPAKAADVFSVGEEEDGMEWEDVTPAVVPATANSSDSRPKRVQGTAKAMEIPAVENMETKRQEKDEAEVEVEEDDMQWEDVLTETKLNDVPASRLLTAMTPDLGEQAEGHSALVPRPSQGESKVEQDEDEDELYLTLKNEMEDAKAHEDLNLLKDEALQSAMATASNLTQWAAGAVRRALEAHSQQHGRLGLSTTVAASESLRSPNHGITAEQPIELSDEEDKAEASPSSNQEANVVVINDEDEDHNGKEAKSEAEAEAETSDDERLQAAIAASLADEFDAPKEKPSGGRVRYLQYTTHVEPSTTLAPDVDESQGQIEDAATLEREQRELKRLRSRQLRDTEGITDEMVEEVMALLRLFGVPFLVSPMEAEAQCAALEQLGLVDGVITDDSDIFPFGGQRVYKNIFHHQRFVEAFSARDVERELGFSREQIIALALLLGSDYTDGVRGIGIVNAAEVAAAYPGIDGLREFKNWVQDFNVVEEAQRVGASGSKKKKRKGDDSDSDSDSDDKDEDDTARQRFQRSHASVRRRWELGDEFPSKHVVDAYLAPQVDRSEARFSWSAPDLAALRNYCANAFGWDQRKSDGVLLPLAKKTKAAATAGPRTGRQVQTRLDGFFRGYDDQVRYAQIRSKRLRSAVTSSTKNKDKAAKKRK